MVSAALPCSDADYPEAVRVNCMGQAGALRGPGIGRRWRWGAVVVDDEGDGDGDVLGLENRLGMGGRKSKCGRAQL